MEADKREDAANRQDNCGLNAGVFQGRYQIVHHDSHLAVKHAHLPRLRFVETDHGGVVAKIARTSSKPVNISGRDNPGEENCDAELLQPAIIAAGRIRNGPGRRFAHVRTITYGVQKSSYQAIKLGLSGNRIGDDIVRADDHGRGTGHGPVCAVPSMVVRQRLRKLRWLPASVAMR